MKRIVDLLSEDEPLLLEIRRDGTTIMIHSRMGDLCRDYGIDGAEDKSKFSEEEKCGIVFRHLLERFALATGRMSPCDHDCEHCEFVTCPRAEVEVDGSN